MPHILIVEDETIIRSALRRLLERNQYQISEAGSVQEARENYSVPEFDLVISDLRLPGAPGTEMIQLAQGKPVLIMTSYASLRSAVDSMRMGAVDYIAKPFDHDEMLQAVARILREHQQKAATVAPRMVATAEENNGEIGIIGSCPSMQALYGKIRKVAPTSSNVLIQGESGTGKELVARALHNLSKRTKIYSAYSYLDNDNSRFAGVGDGSNSGAYAAGNGYSAGVWQQGFNLGVQHKF